MEHKCKQIFLYMYRCKWVCVIEKLWPNHVVSSSVPLHCLGKMSSIVSHWLKQGVDLIDCDHAEHHLKFLAKWISPSTFCLSLELIKSCVYLYNRVFFVSQLGCVCITSCVCMLLWQFLSVCVCVCFYDNLCFYVCVCVLTFVYMCNFFPSLLNHFVCVCVSLSLTFCHWSSHSF